RSLPTHYLISTFWNGQEGSFLLWMFWQAALGIVLIHTNRFWEAPVMTVFALVQAFLASMILGVVLPVIDLKIGGSPFILLPELGAFRHTTAALRSGTVRREVFSSGCSGRLRWALCSFTPTAVGKHR